MSDVKTYALDIAERAGAAAWQGAAGAALPILISADASKVAHLAWWQQLVGVAVAGALAAVLSAGKSILAGLRTGTASLSRRVAATAVPQAGLVPPAVVEAPAAPVDVPPANSGGGFVLSDAQISAVLGETPPAPAPSGEVAPPVAPADPAPAAQ